LRGQPLPPAFVPGLRECIADAFASRLRAIEGAVELIHCLNVPYCVASGGPRDKIPIACVADNVS